MKQRMIKFPKITDFISTVKNIRFMAQYNGQDEINKAIIDYNTPLPSNLKYHATEKIHGTNAGVSYNNKLGYWVQSRNNILTIERDNAGCYLFSMKRKSNFINIINNLAEYYNIDLDVDIITIFFEFAGGNIQSYSALSNYDDKVAIIFSHFKVSPIVEEVNGHTTKYSQLYNGRWESTKAYNDNENSIYNINNFKSYEGVIDVNDINKSVAEFNNIIAKLEDNSPVGQSFGIDGNIGEGVVVSLIYNNRLIRFKVKGSKHSKSKVKTLTPVDDKLEQRKIDFCNKFTCTPERLEQFYQQLLHENNNDISMKNFGSYIKYVMKDIAVEECDNLIENELNMKMINKYAVGMIKSYYVDQLYANIAIKNINEGLVSEEESKNLMNGI